jgi:hypothetical protein
MIYDVFAEMRMAAEMQAHAETVRTARQFREIQDAAVAARHAQEVRALHELRALQDLRPDAITRACAEMRRDALLANHPDFGDLDR